MKKIAIVGGGGHAKSIIDAIRTVKRSAIVIYDDTKKIGDSVLGCDVVGSIEDLVKSEEELYVVIAIGDNFTRSRLAERLIGKKCATIIHSSAQIATGVEIGMGTVILANAIVGADSVIGEHVIINNGAAIDHDNLIESYSSLAPRAVTGGNVTVGFCSAICIGAVVSNKTIIGSRSVVGAGSVVLKDVDERSLYYGVPAKKIRTRMVSEPYL